MLEVLADLFLGQETNYLRKWDGKPDPLSKDTDTETITIICLKAFS